MNGFSIFVSLLAGVSGAAFSWVLLTNLWDYYDKWRSRVTAETSEEFEEMLYNMSPEHFINISIGTAIGAGALAFLLFGKSASGWNWTTGILFGSLAAVVTIIIARGFLKLMRKRRLERFNDQLEEALMSMSNSLRAGFSIMQAIEMVIKQRRKPISIEFKLMVQQTKLGVNFDEALSNAARRIGSEDFLLTVSAIRTARTTGGDLTGVFDRLAVMIRERRRIQRRIQTLTAQGRLQGLVLGLLPMLLLFVLYVMEPEMVRGFFGNPLGIVLFLFVIGLEACGYLVIRKIVSIDI